MELPETTKDITVVWLNQVLHANGFLGSANVVSLKVDQLGVGTGFNSDMAKLTLALDQESPHLPQTMIAKLPPSDVSIREMQVRNKIFEREIRFYLDVAPKSPIRTPRLIYGGMDFDKQRYVMLMEDLSYCTPADPDLQGLTYEQTRIAVSKMADFHARWWNDSALSRFAWLPKQKGQGITRVTAINRFRTLWDNCVKIEEFRKALPEGSLEAGQKICEQYPWLIENLPEDHLTIRHPDLRSDNMFFDWDTSENPLIVFDWGSANIGRGMSSLSFTLGFSLATELRRRIEKDVVKLYHETLLSRGISGYSLDKCWTDYLTGLLTGTGIPLVAFSERDHSDPRSSKLVNVTTHRWFLAILDNEATSILP